MKQMQYVIETAASMIRTIFPLGSASSVCGD